MSVFILSNGESYQVMSTNDDCGLSTAAILAKDVPEGYAAKETTAEAVEATPLDELWNSL